MAYRYNAYRVSRSGTEWEKPNPEEPWSNIGYWGDHQIIYLQKFLELMERFQPGELAQLMTRVAVLQKREREPSLSQPNLT